MAINMCRAERMTLAGARGGTEDTVAPGSYQTATSCIKAETERPVAFASGVDKVCCPNLTTSGYTPGPGSYVAQKNSVDEALGLGQTSMRSKGRRIGPTAPGSSAYSESTVHLNPGPGTYGTKGEWELALKKPPRAAFNPWREKPEKTVPSIPLQKLPPGAQAENSMGSDMSNLTMRHTGETRDHVGPGEYDPKSSLITPSQPQVCFQSGGVRKDRNLWDATGSINSKVVPKDNPGPGAYDARAYGEGESEKQGTYQFASKTVLSHQKEQPDGKAAPGPGQYDALGQIDKQAMKARAHSTTHGENTRFGSASARIGWTRPVDMPYVDPYHVHNVPGPGSYPTSGGTFPAASKDKEKEAAKAVPGNKRKKFYGIHHPMIVMALQETQGPLEAFGSTDDRHCNKVQAQGTPAPWAYNKEEARGHSMGSELREKKKVGRSGAFGSLADRFYGSPLEGRDGGDPGMGGDSDGTTMQGGANSEPRSMFASQTPRMQGSTTGEVHAVSIGHSETPAPGAYDITNEINYRSPFRHPRHDHLSFGACQDRFEFGKGIFEANAAMENPAPGEYNYKLPKSGVNGCAVVKDLRKMAQAVGCTTSDVGPGSYGNIDTPMLKKTYNVSTTTPRHPLGTPRRNQVDAKNANFGYGG